MFSIDRWDEIWEQGSALDCDKPLVTTFDLLEVNPDVELKVNADTGYLELKRKAEVE